MIKKFLKLIRYYQENGHRCIYFYLNSSRKKYENWIQKNEKTINWEEIKGKYLYFPLISILLPVYNSEPNYLKACINGVLNQEYPNWELCIVDDCSTDMRIKSILNDFRNQDDRIHVLYRDRNGHISQTTNDALKMAKGDFIALLDHDDLLAANALMSVVEVLNNKPDLDFIYSDEDKINKNGKRCFPFFKPDWSPDMLLSQNYICHLAVIRKTLADSVNGFELGLEGAQDHDFFLKCTEKTDKIYHIPQILYHWRMSSKSTALNPTAKNYAFDAGLVAVKNGLDRRGLSGQVVEGRKKGCYLIDFDVMDTPKVSVIIPMRDHAEDTKRCMESIISKSGWYNYEIILVDNGSIEPKTEDMVHYYQRKLGDVFSVIKMDIPFNYSRLNNVAAKKATGDYLLLLNNDIEMISDGWMAKMLGYAQQEHIGAVGAFLYYADNTIQHAGVMIGIRGCAGHSHKCFKSTAYGYQHRLCTVADYAAVTGACLMVSRELYEKNNGLDEDLFGVAFNDIDFCLKLIDQGYYNVCLPQVEGYHYESRSRGQDKSGEKLKRFEKEKNNLQEKWPGFIENDPFYSPHLTREREDYSINRSE